ncbi:hypothetical protein Bbelb_255740 [Branchiostoma belcheri]|nr:hypothetical protein Bbelb_255740 [Branchiostoma belcheri]
MDTFPPLNLPPYWPTLGGPGFSVAGSTGGSSGNARRRGRGGREEDGGGGEDGQLKGADNTLTTPPLRALWKYFKHENQYRGEAFESLQKMHDWPENKPDDVFKNDFVAMVATAAVGMIPAPFGATSSSVGGTSHRPTVMTESLHTHLSGHGYLDMTMRTVIVVMANVLHTPPDRKRQRKSFVTIPLFKVRMIRPLRKLKLTAKVTQFPVKMTQIPVTVTQILAKHYSQTLGMILE